MLPFASANSVKFKGCNLRRRAVTPSEYCDVVLRLHREFIAVKRFLSVDRISFRGYNFSMAVFNLKNVKVKYRYGAIACASLNLTLKSGDKLAAVGDFASGKSTLLKLLAGLADPNDGTFTIDGTEASGVSPKERNAVFVQDRIWLFNLRSAEYNLTYSSKIRGERGAELIERAKAAAERVGFSADLKTPVFRLSKADKIKLCYARLFMRDADIYLVDDLFKELGEEERGRLTEAVFDWAKETDKTVVIATENLNEAKRFTDRVLLMSYGVQVAEGKVSEISENIPSVWAAKMLFPENDIQNGKISEINGKIVLSSGGKDYDLNRELLLDGLFVGKEVSALFCGNTVFIFDIKSENLIYPINS